MINQDQVYGILRILVPTICALLVPYLSALGDAGTVAAITAATVAVAGAVWSFASHTEAAKIASAAKVDPQVHIQVPVALAASDHNIQALVINPSINVTSTP